MNEEVCYEILEPSVPEHSSDTLDELIDVLAQSVDDWRIETLPERDNLRGNSQGDNERHVIVRGVFLDLFFRDERTNAFIDTLINRSPPLKERLSEIAKISDLWHLCHWHRFMGSEIVLPGTMHRKTWKVDLCSKHVLTGLVALS